MSESHDQLREQYPDFIYRAFRYQLDDDNVFTTEFTYEIPGLAEFHHQVSFGRINRDNYLEQPPDLLNNVVFHLGLIEAFSYWKLTASPHFIIEPFCLTAEQLSFWHETLLQGMGEYFYVNQIEFWTDDFVLFTCRDTAPALPALASATKHHPRRVSAVNLGGGKDSAVMLSLLEKFHEEFVQIIVQPGSPAAQRMAELTQKSTYVIKRTFDPQLFAFNQQNFLNGHVPFSASLAFINIVAGVLFDFDFALVGNESSADQSSLLWQGHHINHQYSKSTKFEQEFSAYIRQNVIDNVKYCSLLRVFNELQIAHIFCTNNKYFSIFRSCNRAQQQNRWCQQCPKCLCVFILLAPFLDEDILTTQIFDHNLLDDDTLDATLQALIGLTPDKPLECVGTREELAACLYLYGQYLRQHDLPFPRLLAAHWDAILSLHPHYPSLVQQLSITYHTTPATPLWALRLTSEVLAQILLT